MQRGRVFHSLNVLWNNILRTQFASPEPCRSAAGKPWLPIQQCRISEIPCHVLRVECIGCFRIIEIQKADALRYYGPHAV